MRPRTVDIEGERLELASRLQRLIRDAFADWQSVGTGGQKERQAEFRAKRRVILLRLRELRRIERHRTATDARRRIAAAAKEADAQ